MTTIINTDWSKNIENWKDKGYSIYVTRTQQRCKKYKADKWLKYFGNKYKKLGNYKRWLERDTMMKSEWLQRDFILADMIKHKEITLLCFCEDVNLCHRKILAEWLCDTYPEHFTKGDIK